MAPANTDEMMSFLNESEEASTADKPAWRVLIVDDEPDVHQATELALNGVLIEGRTVDFVRDLLEATLSRPATLGCFGLHEWAMVHGIPEGGVRHENWPLRLGATATDEVTRSHTVRCSHFDAFRFFTDSGRQAGEMTCDPFSSVFSMLPKVTLKSPKRSLTASMALVSCSFLRSSANRDGCCSWYSRLLRQTPSSLTGWLISMLSNRRTAVR